MMSLWDVYTVPSTRVPIDITSLVSYVLPVIVCHFVVAVLAVTPKTYPARVALWPITVALAFRAVVSVDVSLGKPILKTLDGIFVCCMFGIVIRTFHWAFTKEPLVRHRRPANGTSSTIMDALDLTTNLRGLGWNWSHGLYVPPETRPTGHRIAFAFSTLLSAIAHAFVSSISYTALLSFSAKSITTGLIIVDESLPFLLRYLRASVISTCTAFMAYASLHLNYDLYTILFVLFFRQDPALWPPSFEAPWRATSLHDFWGRRWHQWVRSVFLSLGGYPLSVFLGQSGIVLGAFLASALLHDIMIARLDSSVSAWWMLVGFGMMGPGLLAERAFYKLTGKRVGGVLGWIWTMVWLLSCGTAIFEGFARATGGLDYDYSSLHIDGMFRPVGLLIERLVMDFDVWVHTI